MDSPTDDEKMLALFLTSLAKYDARKGRSLLAMTATCLREENRLRSAFAGQQTDDIIIEPYSGLIDIFAAPISIRTIRARVIRRPAQRDDHYIFPLKTEDRRSTGSPSMTPTFKDFLQNWQAFSLGILEDFPFWANTLIAGGAIHACLTPLPTPSAMTARDIKGHYQRGILQTADIDIFIWGLEQREARTRIKEITTFFQSKFAGSGAHTVLSKHAITIKPPHPHRVIQIILRIFESPAHIMAEFDLAVSCFLFNGRKVMGTPSAILSFMQQVIRIDIVRRSTSFELRLAKYALRGLEIYVPSLERHRVDPIIYIANTGRLHGLGLLLGLERKITRMGSFNERCAVFRAENSRQRDGYARLTAPSLRKIQVGNVVDMRVLYRQEPVNTYEYRDSALEMGIWLVGAYRNID